MVWQGAFKTCRHLQTSCVSAKSLEEVKLMVGELLNTSSFTQFATQPTDAYPSLRTERGSEDTGSSLAGGQPRKKRKRKRH